MQSTDLKCSRYLFINWKVNNVSVTSESTTNLHWGILCLLHELCFLVENLTHWTDTWKQGIVGSKNKIRTGLFLYKDYIYEIDKVFCENHLRHSRFILLLLYIKKRLFMIKGHAIKICLLETTLLLQVFVYK